MMRLIPFEPAHLREMDWQEAQADQSILAANMQTLKAVAAASYALTGVTEAGRIVGCAGLAPSVIEVQEDGARVVRQSHAWAAFSPLLFRYAKSAYAAILRELNKRTEDRIELVVKPEHRAAASFAERLHFVFDGIRYDPDLGRALYVYARVRT